MASRLWMQILHPSRQMPPSRDAQPTQAASAMSEDSLHFLAAWKAWRGTALLPQRCDMDLVSIARLMPKLALLEIASAEHAVFRLAGTEIESLVGLRLTGRDYVALAKPEYRAPRSRLLWNAVSQPCGLISHHAFADPATGQMHRIETLALPMRPNEEGAPLQLLAVVSRLPDLRGASTTAPLEQIAVTQAFIDIGAGIPLSA